LVKTSTLAVILAALIISVALTAEADGAGLVWRAVNKAGSSIHHIANVTEHGCALNQILKVNSTADWACAADSTGTSGITSINADTTAAQLILGVAGNTTSLTSAGTTTINLGSNVLMTTGSNQTVSANKILKLNGSNVIKTSNTGLIIRNPTSSFATTIAGGAVAGNITLTLPITTTTLAGLGTTQTWTGVNTMTGLNTILVNQAGLTIRNPADTFKYTIQSSAITADRTLNLPVTTATDTLMTLGVASQNVTNGLLVTGFTNKVINATTTYSVLANDDTILVHPAKRVPYTITLPAIASIPKGKIYSFFYTGTLGTPVTVDGNGAEKIYNALNLNMTEFRENVSIQSNGASWFILNQPVASGKSTDGTLLIEDEFSTGGTTTNTIGTQGWTLYGTTIPGLTGSPTAGKPGSINLSTPSTRVSVLSLGSTTIGTGSLIMPTDYYSLSAMIRIANPLTSELDFGVSENIVQPNQTATTHHAMFVYNNTRTGNNWSCSVGAGAATDVKSGVVASVAGTYYNLRIVKPNSTGTDFWVNDRLACTINTNTPTNDVSPFIRIAGRAGGTASIDIDSFRLFAPTSITGR